ncbi:MFS transporter [Kribbella sp. NPDC055071]
MTALQATTTLSPARKVAVLVICCTSLLVSVMDISIVNVALPSIRDDLQASTAGLQWTVDAYTLVLACFLLLAGSSADRFGRRRMFRLGLISFGVGSLLCSLAPSIGVLIAARAIQAVGGTMLNPVGQALVVLSLGGLVAGIIESEKNGWGTALVLALLAVAAISAVALIASENRRAQPLLELRLFRSVPFSSAVVIALFAYCGFGAFLFVTTLYLQSVRGLSALAAGLCLLPVGVLIIVLSPLTGRIVGSIGPRLPLVVAGTALTLTAVASLGIGPATPLFVVLATFLLFGIFLGTVNPPIANSAVSGMPASMTDLAASLASVGRQTGVSLGIAIAGSIVGSTATDPRVFTRNAHTVWWPTIGMGVVVVVLALVSTSAWAQRTVR